MQTRTMSMTALLALALLAGCGPLTTDPAPSTSNDSGRVPTNQIALRPVATAGPAPTGAAAPAATVVRLQTDDPAAEPASAPAPATRAPNQAQAPDASALAPLSAVEVVDQVWPAVVTVVNERLTGPLGGGDVQQAGRGTGFIIDDQGHIVTNEHVVSGSDRVEVIFDDGEKRPAELIGTDPLSDLAVVRVDGELPAVVDFGNSEALEVGQPILAIGSPLGEFSGTVTDGIISALNRDFPEETGSIAAYNNLIQHNAAINPGNSGGPLFDLQGQVIGVNTLGIPLLPDGSPVQGLFFAIPSNSVSQVAAQLIENGRAIYPYFGVNARELYPELAAEYELPVEYGAYLTEVVPDSPADQAGIEIGDIVTTIGDLSINARRGFQEALYQFEPGDTVPVTLMRGEEKIEVEITLGELQN